MKGLYFAPGSATQLPIEPDVGAHDLFVRAAGVDLRLPLNAARLELGGTDQAYVVCTFPHAGAEHVVYLERSGIVAALELAGASPDFVASVKSLSGAHSRRVAGRLAVLGSIALVLLLLVGVVLLKLEGWAVAAVPPQLEVSMGKAAWDEHKKGLTLERDPALQGFVDGIGERLLAAQTDQPYAFKFHVVRDETLNAFALPGGTIVVHTALIAKAETPEEVAGVIGHEIAHVLQRHSLRQGIRNLGTLALLSLVFGDSTSALEASLGLLRLKYSRDHEREADAVGAKILHQAGLDPHNVGKVLARIAKEQTVTPPEILSTHPMGEGRTQQVEAAIRALPAVSYTTLGISPADWTAIKTKARAP